MEIKDGTKWAIGAGAGALLIYILLRMNRAASSDSATADSATAGYATQSLGVPYSLASYGAGSTTSPSSIAGSDGNADLMSLFRSMQDAQTHSDEMQANLTGMNSFLSSFNDFVDAGTDVASGRDKGHTIVTGKLSGNVPLIGGGKSSRSTVTGRVTVSTDANIHTNAQPRASRLVELPTVKPPKSSGGLGGFFGL